MAAGRYFVYRDPRFYSHCLSNMILRLKDFKPYAANILASCLSDAIEPTQNIQGHIDIITVVPSKPGKDNHLAPIMKNVNIKKFNHMIDMDLLFTTRHYGKQQDAGSTRARAKNVQNVFDAKKKMSGHILLIDDVFTSGSTALECAKVLYKYGAEKVTLLPLAITQTNLHDVKHEKIKDQNNRVYRLNFNRKDGNPFWVASNKQFLNYYEGKEKYFNQNSDQVPELEW